MNLDSVQPSEIRVLVGGELCNIEGQPSAELLFCLPPQEAPNGILQAPVQVMIGQNLTYQAGVLVYATTGVSAVTIAVAVAVPIAALAIIAVLIMIGVVVIMRQTQQKKR